MNAFFIPSNRGINFAKIRGFKVTDYKCLAAGIVPFIITEELKMFYYRGLKNWPSLPGYLRDTCLTAQDNYKQMMEYFEIKM